MKFGDAGRARSALTLLLVASAARLGLYVLEQLISRLAHDVYGSPTELVLQLFWVGLAGVTVVGLIQLSSALEDSLLPVLTAALVSLNAVGDLAISVMSVTGNLGIFGAGSSALFGLSMLFSLVERGLLLWVLVSLATPRFSWTMPVAAVVMLLSTVRMAFSFAMSSGLVDPQQLYASGVYGLVTGLVSFGNAFAVLAITWFARLAVLEAASGAPAVPPREQGLQPTTVVDTPASPTMDFVAGGALLLIGVAVTVVSVSAASNGGRYVVATGAIGVGIGRLIRGFIRLGKQSG